MVNRMRDLIVINLLTLIAVCFPLDLEASDTQLTEVEKAVFEEITSTILTREENKRRVICVAGSKSLFSVNLLEALHQDLALRDLRFVYVVSDEDLAQAFLDGFPIPYGFEGSDVELHGLGTLYENLHVPWLPVSFCAGIHSFTPPIAVGNGTYEFERAWYGGLLNCEHLRIKTKIESGQIVSKAREILIIC